MNLSSDVVFLSSRNSNANVTIRSVDDNFYEGPESVDLRITSSDRAVMFSPNELTVAINIMDNECTSVAQLVRVLPRMRVSFKSHPR